MTQWGAFVPWRNPLAVRMGNIAAIARATRQHAYNDKSACKFHG
jgi:hypothetical protein